MNAQAQTNGDRPGYAPMPPSREDKIEGRLNAEVLQSIIMETEARGGGAGVFKIENGGQLWEVAKMMALSGPAVAHPLRGKPYLCFAVAQQAQRWRMDPFAVGSKAYVTKSKDRETGEMIERIAYEAQLVNAVINTNAPIKARPDVVWEGIGDKMVCTVSATFINEDKPKSLPSPTAGSIQPKNSPLWRTAQHIQLAYWTLRAWARLYCPEVLLGVYTPDELEAEDDMVDTTGTPAPPRPTREQFPTDKMFREQLGEPDPSDTPHDPETGEVIEQTESAESGTSASAPADAPAAGAPPANSTAPAEAKAESQPVPNAESAPAAEPKPEPPAPKPASQAQPQRQAAPATARKKEPVMEPETTSEAVYRNVLKWLDWHENEKAIDTYWSTDKKVAALRTNNPDLYDLAAERKAERKRTLAKAK